MEKVITESFDEAREKASLLSDNLYHDTDFTPAAFRTFLDNLPPVVRVYVQQTIKDDTPCVGLCTIYFDTFSSKANRTSISILFEGTWLTDVYFRFHRSVPRTYIFTYEYEPDLPF